jgi:CubicO group peptidase (beta-lactamase class C family)
MSKTSLIIYLLFLAYSPTTGQGGADKIWPGSSWERATPEQVGMDASTLQKARDYALTGGGSGCVIRYGRLTMQWGDQKQRYDLKSTTKAIGVTAVGLAIKDGKIKSLGELAKTYHPKFGIPPESNAETGWLDKITLFHLAAQTAGFDKSGGYTKLLFAPGTKWCYSDGGPNWLAECVTSVYKQDLNELMFNRVFGPIDISASDLTWRNNADETMVNVPPDAYWSWGLYDSLIVVIPSLDIVAARAGKSLNKARNSNYKAIEPFIEPIVLSLREKTQ